MTAHKTIWRDQILGFNYTFCLPICLPINRMEENVSKWFFFALKHNRIDSQNRKDWKSGEFNARSTYIGKQWSLNNFIGIFIISWYFGIPNWFNHECRALFMQKLLCQVRITYSGHNGDDCSLAAHLECEIDSFSKRWDRNIHQNNLFCEFWGCSSVMSHTEMRDKQLNSMENIFQISQKCHRTCTFPCPTFSMILFCLKSNAFEHTFA